MEILDSFRHELYLRVVCILTIVESKARSETGVIPTQAQDHVGDK